MASKVNEVICRQFGQSCAAQGGWTNRDGRTVAYFRSCAVARESRATLRGGIIVYRRQNIGKSTVGEGNGETGDKREGARSDTCKIKHNFQTSEDSPKGTDAKSPFKFSCANFAEGKVLMELMERARGREENGLEFWEAKIRARIARVREGTFGARAEQSRAVVHLKWNSGFSLLIIAGRRKKGGRTDGRTDGRRGRESADQGGNRVLVRPSFPLSLPPSSAFVPLFLFRS